PGATTAGWRARAVGTLPDTVDAAALVPLVRLQDPEWYLPLGIGDVDLEPIGLQLGEADNALVAGPPRCGKSTGLAALAVLVATCDAGPRVTTVALRRSPLRDAPADRSVVEAGDLAGALDEVSAHVGPQLLLIDDADLVDDP